MLKPKRAILTPATQQRILLVTWLAAAVLASSAFSSSARALEQNDPSATWILSDDSNYVSVNLSYSVNANEADTYCNDWFGTSLASIHSIDQNTGIAQKIYGISWIGLIISDNIDNDDNENVEWIDNSHLSLNLITNPDTVGDCIRIRREDLDWRRTACGNRYSYLVCNMHSDSEMQAMYPSIDINDMVIINSDTENDNRTLTLWCNTDYACASLSLTSNDSYTKVNVWCDAAYACNGLRVSMTNATNVDIWCNDGLFVLSNLIVYYPVVCLPFK